MSGSGFDNSSRLLSSFPVRSALILGGDFNAEVGCRVVREDECVGPFAHGRSNHSGHQVVEWAKGEALRFLETFHLQDDRNTWYHPLDGRGHPLDHVLCRFRDHRFLGSVRVLHEHIVRGSRSPTWSACTDHNPVEVRLLAPNERHAALHQMLLGKAAGADEVTAELLRFGGESFWEWLTVRFCREQRLLLTEAAPGAEWFLGLVVPVWKKKGSKKVKGNWRGMTLLSVGSKLIARVVAACLRSFFDGCLGHHQFGFRQGKGVDDALQVT